MKATRLKAGDTIPEIWTRDVRGRVVDSKHFPAGRMLLVFLRFAGCPFCNLALYRLAREHTALQAAGCEIVVFVQSDDEDIEKSIYQRHDVQPKFPIVADKAMDFYRLFGVTTTAAGFKDIVRYSVKHRSQWLDAVRHKGFAQTDINGNSFIVPAYFLVDSHGVVKVANYTANLYDDTAYEAMYDAFEAEAKQKDTL